MKLDKVLTLQQIAEAIGASLQGDPNCQISGVATLVNAKAGELSFLSSKQYRKDLPETSASAVILNAEDKALCKTNALICKDPRLGLAKVMHLLMAEKIVPSGIHPSAIIGEQTTIPASTFIGPHVVIGDRVTLGEHCIIDAGSIVGNDCILGDYTHIKPRCVLYDHVRIGQYGVFHSGVVIGSDGFGFANDAGSWMKLPHLGGVVIGDQVEIGANTTIDRGFLEDTVISNGVIIDNLVQIGHNVSIGNHTAIAGCVAIAGSTKIGGFCMIGGGACIGGHLTIVDQVYITAMSGVNQSLMSSGIYSSGLPAKPADVWRKNAARFGFLNSMYKRLHAIENKVDEMQTILEESE